MKLYILLVVLTAMIGLTPASVDAPGAAALPRCDTTLEPVIEEDLPDDVAAFADGRPIVGEGDLWLLLNRPDLNFRFDVDSDQWVLHKVVWYPRSSDGSPDAIEIVERRLGSSQRVASELAGDSFADGFTFRVNSLSFPRGGCWRITASLEDSRVRFHVRVPKGRRPICDDLAAQLEELRSISNEAHLDFERTLTAALDDKGC